MCSTAEGAKILTAAALTSERGFAAFCRRETPLNPTWGGRNSTLLEFVPFTDKKVVILLLLVWILRTETSGDLVDRRIFSFLLHLLAGRDPDELLMLTFIFSQHF